jgi:hypothetical protein
MSTNKNITFIVENSNNTIKHRGYIQPPCDKVKRLFEDINFIENAHVSMYASKQDPYGDVTEYYNLSFLVIGDLKNDKFLNLCEIISNTDNKIPFSIGEHKFLLYRLSTK